MPTYDLLAVLLLAATASTAAGGGDPRGCLQVPFACGAELTACNEDPVCVTALACMGDCEITDAECSFTCTMEGLESEVFTDFLQCTADVGCLPDYEEDGLCLAEDSDALQSLTDMGQVEGDWWVLKGQNCGQDDVWRGGYDWYPCQHNRFLRLESGDWINNTTYCSGSDSVCTSEIFVTVPDAYVSSPGVVRCDYPQGEAPILPQIEDWKFMSIPHPDWAFVVWCGSNPALEYNGAFVISRNRNLDPLSELPEVEAELRAAAEAVGIDFDQMCVSDNTECPV